jgi:single-stranded-DNA-specific exonuclease
MRTPMNRAWAIQQQLDRRSVERYASSARIGTLTAELLMRRGFSSPEIGARFLAPSESEVINPYAMKGMRLVADRVREEIAGHERILIYGDYDADGIPGTALLANWMRTNGAAVATFIPNREDGYGMSATRAKDLLARHAPQLVITVDLGSSDHDAIRVFTSVGIDVVVVDHHLTLKGAPPTPYFINTSRSDGETYPTRGVLCGCGTAYKLIQAISSRAHERHLYDLVALSTVADQVPLVSENRFFVKAALEILHTGTSGNLGIRALANIAGKSLSTLTAEDIGWIIAPRINAVGRMGADPNLAVDLLTTNDTAEAGRIAAQMNALNGDRQQLTGRLYEEVISQVSTSSSAPIVVFLRDATVGVAGLVAAKVVETYGRPTLVVNGEGRGSGRAPDGMSIMTIMDQLRVSGVFGSPRKTTSGDVVTPDYGGHEGACGFHNVEPQRLVAAASRITANRSGPMPILIDAIGTLGEVTDRFVAETMMLNPFGVGNPDPHYLFRNLVITEHNQSRSGSSLLFTVSDGVTSRRAFWFGGGDRSSSLPARVDLLARPEAGYNGNAPELRVYDIRAAE